MQEKKYPQTSIRIDEETRLSLKLLSIKNKVKMNDMLKKLIESYNKNN